MLEDVERSSVNWFKVRRSSRFGREDSFGDRTLVDDDPFRRRRRATSVVLIDEFESLKDSVRGRRSREGEESVGRVVSVVKGKSSHQELDER